MIRISHPQDFWSGLLFTALGAAGAYMSSKFAFGTLTRMGPGFLPSVLSWSLIAVGVLVTLRSFAMRGGSIQPSMWRPQILIVAAIILFALLIERIGMIPTVFLVIIVASFASDEFRLRDAVMLGAGMSVVCYLVFVMLLSLPLQPLAWNF